MDFNIQEILNHIHKYQDDYIVEMLKKHHIVTNNRAISDYIKEKYPDINISFCGYLDDGENQMYLIDKDYKIAPIQLVYETPHFERDEKNMVYKCYNEMYLEAGGVRLL